MREKIVPESELSVLAKEFREKAGRTRTEAARDLKIALPTLFQAEENPSQSLRKLRVRIIEKYSENEVIGPVYVLRKRP